MLGGELGALHGQAYLVADNMQQLQFFFLQLPPIFARHIQYSQWRCACIDRHAGMEAQAPRRRVMVTLGMLETATAKYIDVRSSFKAAFQKSIKAKTITGHTF